MTLLLTPRALAAQKRHLPWCPGPCAAHPEEFSFFAEDRLYFYSRFPNAHLSGELGPQSPGEQGRVSDVRKQHTAGLSAHPLCVKTASPSADGSGTGDAWGSVGEDCLPALPAAQLSVLSKGHRSLQTGMLQRCSTGRQCPAGTRPCSTQQHKQ